MLGVGLVVLLNLPDSVSQNGKALIREFLAPLQSAVTQAFTGTRQWWGAARSLGEMALTNQHMAEELTRLRSELRYLQGLEAENQALRAQLGFQSRPDRQLIPAEIIGRDITGWWQSVRIGQGAAEGIEAGMAMVTPDGLVGRTMNVSIGTADVLLISDPSCRISAHVSDAQTHGIVSGLGLSFRGQPTLEMVFINKDATIRPGDEVVTSGLGDRYPRGILIGHVEQVTRDDSGLYQSATIAPAADIGRLTYGFVVVETPDPVDDLLGRWSPAAGDPS